MFQGCQDGTESAHCAPSPIAAPATCCDRGSARGKQLASNRSHFADSAVPRPHEPNTLLRQRAFRAVQLGDIEAAIALFDQLIQHDPSSVSDYNNRGLLHFQNGELTAALADYNTALKLNPQLAKVYNNRANCFAAMGLLLDALFDYEMAIDLNPANIHARINQGITFRELEMYEHATENFDLALQLHEIMSDTALTSATTALNGHIYAHRGRTHHLSGDWNCAAADYQRAIALLPTHATALDASTRRLRTQVELWLEALLSPLFSC